MRPAKSFALALLALALSWSAPTSSAPSIGDANGWYKWQVEGGMTMGSSCCYHLAGQATQRTTCNLDGGHSVVISKSPCGDSSGITTFYVHKENGKPTRIRAFDSNCDVSASESITDLGSLSQEDSVVMLLGIVKRKNFDMDVREDALFWLAQSNSDSAFEYFDQLLSDT